MVDELFQRSSTMKNLQKPKIVVQTKLDDISMMLWNSVVRVFGRPSFTHPAHLPQRAPTRAQPSNALGDVTDRLRLRPQVAHHNSTWDPVAESYVSFMGIYMGISWKNGNRIGISWFIGSMMRIWLDFHGVILGIKWEISWVYDGDVKGNSSTTFRNVWTIHGTKGYHGDMMNLMMNTMEWEYNMIVSYGNMIGI